MTKYIQKRFAMSAEGAKNTTKAIGWTALQFISFMLPTAMGGKFLMELVNALQGGTQPSFSLWFYIPVSLAMLLVICLISYMQYGATYNTIYEESAKSRINLAETLRKLPLAFFGRRNIADLSSTIMEDATQIENLFSHAVPQVYAAGISIVLVFVGLFFFEWRLALALFWVLPLSAALFLSSRSFQKRLHQTIYQRKREISDAIQEGMDNAQVIKSCNGEAAYTAQLNAQLDGYERFLVKTELLLGAIINLSHALLHLGLPSVMLVGGVLLTRGEVGLFTYIIFLVIAGRIYTPVMELINNMAALLYLNSRIERIRDMHDMPRQTGSTAFAPTNHDIVFEGVDFSYQGDVETLRGVSLTARQGEVTALVGPSGGGKSTIAKLAARFWDVDAGRITLGGHDIAKVDPETLLQSFSIVFQDVTLFNATIMENIRLGKKDASDEEVLQAARLAQCDAFVSRLPEGYDTLVGENGARLSGGERQRISIARALLKDAPVILLDEATASVDSQSESKIQKALGALVKDKTVIVIAHRMRTILGADKVAVVEKGSIVEEGRPDALMKAGGRLASMVKAQMTDA